MKTIITNIPKRTKNSVKCAVQKLCIKYGVQATRLVINHYFENIKQTEKNRAEITRLQNELKQLKSKGK